MSRREKILTIVAACFVVGWLGLPQLHAIFIAPIEEKQGELDAVNQNLDAATRTLAQITHASTVLKQWRARSLPPDPLDAQRHYQDWLTDLAQLASFEKVKVTPGRITPQGSAYTGVQVVLEAEAQMSHVGEFLYHFYRADLPHRIVSMAVECPQPDGDPKLSIALTAEGLAISGAPRRDYMFPTANLAEAFTSSTSAQQIEVDDVTQFPDGTPLRVRIGNEYLNVTKRDGTSWTVEGGRDATSPARHEAGDVIELAPVWPGYADLTLEDFRQLVGASPFVKVAPQAAPKNEEEIVREDDAVKDTYLAASILTGGTPSAWLYRRGNSERTVIHNQSKLDVGKLHAEVLDIQPDHVLIRADDATWRLSLGDSLSTMEKLPPEADTDASGDGQSGEASSKSQPAASEPADDASASGNSSDDSAATSNTRAS